MTWFTSTSLLGTLFDCVVVYYGLAVVALVCASVAKRRGFGAELGAVRAAAVSPMGTVFGLLVAFLAAEAWPTFDRARRAVGQEASSLRELLVIAEALPEPTAAMIRARVGRHIDHIVREEWPAMSEDRAVEMDNPLKGALVDLLKEDRQEDSARSAKEHAIRAIERALEARRERILLSEGTVEKSKVAVIVALGFIVLLMLAVVHYESAVARRFTVFSFATAAALSLFAILIYAQPFSAGGKFVPTTPLLQIRPGAVPPG